MLHYTNLQNVVIMIAVHFCNYQPSTIFACREPDSKGTSWSICAKKSTINRFWTVFRTNQRLLQ